MKWLNFYILGNATPTNGSSTSTLNSSLNKINKIDSQQSNQAKTDSTSSLLIYYDGNKISVEDLKQENYLIKNENNSLKIRCKALQETIDSIRDKNVKLQTSIDLNRLNKSDSDGLLNENENPLTDTNLIENYIKQIEDLRYFYILLLEKRARLFYIRVSYIKSTRLTCKYKTILLVCEDGMYIKCSDATFLCFDDKQDNFFYFLIKRHHL